MSRIATVPEILITADGLPLVSVELAALAEITVQQKLSLPALCELIFREPAGPLSAVDRLPVGAQLRVDLSGADEPLFSGQVTAVEHVYEAAHGYEVRVRGYDTLHQLRKNQTVRAHVQVTVADLVREVATHYGLQVSPAETGPLSERIIQHRQSDLELLVETAADYGLYLSLRGNTLHLLTLSGIGAPQPLTLGESLLEARFEINGDPACRSVAAHGWNPLRVEPHDGLASSPRTGRTVSAGVPPADVGGSGTRALLNEVAQDDTQAAGRAQAELDQRAAREVTLWGIADGDTSLRPGAVVEVQGVAPALAGRYVLTEVRHTIDERSGYTSEISSMPPPLRVRPAGTLAALGVVTAVNDPQNLARVKVSLPAYDDVETTWMNVLLPAAGADKGLIALPDVGDHVLVLCAQHDPAQGIVLGGLYGMSGAPDSGVDGEAVRRYTFLTPGGQRIRLDDARQTIRVETSAGSFYEMAPGKVRLHAATDLDIEAPGRAVVIRGQTIDFQRG